MRVSRVLRIKIRSWHVGYLTACFLSPKMMMVCYIRLLLLLEKGVLIHQAVVRMVDETRRDEADDPRTNAKNVSAEAFLKSETRSYATSRAAALVRIAEHYLASSSDGARALAPAERYQVLIHVNANDAHPDTQINGGHICHHKSASQENRFLSHEKAAQIACSASITDDYTKATFPSLQMMTI